VDGSSIPGLVAVAGHAGSAVAIIAVDGEESGNHFAGHQTLFLGEFVHHVEGFGNVLRAVNDDGGHCDVADELKQLVAVPFVVTVEAPYPAEHSRAAGGLCLSEALCFRGSCK
jgi:hypothetical protein